MDWFNTLIPEKYLFALGWMIIHALWQIAGVGLLLWLSLKIFNQKSSGFKYRLSIATLFLISMASLATFSFYAGDGKTKTETFAIENLTDQEVIILMNAQNSESQLLMPSSDFTILSKRVENYLPMLVNLWFIGALLFMVRFAGSLADIRNIRVKSHQFPSPKWLEFLENQKKQINIKIPIQFYQSVHVDMPITFGVFKPVILVPASLMFNLSPKQLEAIITHELAHIKRFDYLVNVFQSFLEVIFFFHPIFWWINNLAKEQRENACDDLAIKMGVTPKDLAHGLANVLNHAQFKAPEMAMAATKSKNPTLDRIKRIMGIKISPTQPTPFISMTMIVTLLLSATLMVGAGDQREKNSIEELMETKLRTETIQGNWNGLLAFQKTDTVPPKKAIKIDKDLKGMSEEEKSKLEESMEKAFGSSGIFENESLGNMVIKGLHFLSPDFSNMPILKLNELPLPSFDMENMPMWEFDNDHFNNIFPDSLFKYMPLDIIIMDSTVQKKHPMIIMGKKVYGMDTTKMSREEREQMRNEMREKINAHREERQAYREKMQMERETFMQDLSKKREEYQSQIQPQIKQYQDQIQNWQRENEPLMKEYQAKIKTWQEENKPQIEEFQKQMEAWQQENQVQLQEFQKQMEEWQKDHQKQLQELQKTIQDQFKKGEND